ncbi:MAG TPA: hypothetical protein VFN35_28210 [Ktedonobacteraceae bacterium]|nr:hypothetical protein [Ktedonobacteraceae bacterium]
MGEINAPILAGRQAIPEMSVTRRSEQAWFRQLWSEPGLLASSPDVIYPLLT